MSCQGPPSELLIEVSILIPEAEVEFRRAKSDVVEHHYLGL